MMIRPSTSLSSDLGVKLGCALTPEGNYPVEMKVKSSMAGAFACSEIGHEEL